MACSPLSHLPSSSLGLGSHDSSMTNLCNLSKWICSGDQEEQAGPDNSLICLMVVELWPKNSWVESWLLLNLEP